MDLTNTKVVNKHDTQGGYEKSLLSAWLPDILQMGDLKWRRKCVHLYRASYLGTQSIVVPVKCVLMPNRSRLHANSFVIHNVCGIRIALCSIL